MGYDDWKTRVPDDDPFGLQDDDSCEVCGAESWEPCDEGCTCTYCRARGPAWRTEQHE